MSKMGVNGVEIPHPLQVWEGPLPPLPPMGAEDSDVGQRQLNGTSSKTTLK